MRDLPFRFVEYTSIRAIFAYLCPEATIITRNIARSDLIKMHGREKEKIKFMLKDAPSRISLTSDLWTSVITNGYMCITAHFIDRNWVLQKRVLNFCFMLPPHNGVSLFEKMYNLLCEWEIENKVFSVTLDNASSNDVSVDILRTQLSIRKALVCNGEFFHLRCFAHILNLIVQDGLKEIDIAIQKIRESVKYVKVSQVRKQKFLESVNQMSLDGKRGSQEVPTRWNSIFLMIENALYYRRAFFHLELTESNDKNCPTVDEWSKVEKIDKFLAVFYDATCAFSGTKYPAANLYFPSVFMIYLTLRQQMENEDEYLRRMAIQMLAKFEKYWLDFNVLLAIAVSLDPRYKLQFVDFCCKKLYGYSGSPAYLNVREKLFSLFMEYANNAPTTSTATGKHGGKVVHVSPIQSFSKETRAVMQEFDLFEIEEESAHSQKSQLELYLDEPRVDRSANINILAFWKAIQFRFPELASMARDVLSVPISIVASESTLVLVGE
ncbi:hypothetical protein SO802_006181 [Lithocarpus litseifolius]|uniref:Zinc finger BED domain-containing protein RICESLEEPER 2-like n=1 Tax=Lithocarpus litseifolius TaxID=425828 RepID=A0AAW2DK92_9ROSI